jgi:hypothetical protein
MIEHNEMQNLSNEPNVLRGNPNNASPRKRIKWTNGPNNKVKNLRTDFSINLKCIGLSLLNRSVVTKFERKQFISQPNWLMLDSHDSPSDPVRKQLVNYDSLSHIRGHIGCITELDSQSYNCPPLLSTTISQRLLTLKP